MGSIVLFAVAIFLSVALETFWIVAGVAVVWFLGLVAFCLLTNVLSQVFRAALFIYATEGVVPGPFERDQMNMAWKVASRR